MFGGKSLFCLLIAYLISFECYGQKYIWTSDSITVADPRYAMQRYHEVLRYNDPLMYLVYPVIKPVVPRSVPLMDGEGKDGYIAEGHFGHRFVITQGKYYSHPILQHLRFTFDVSILARLTSDTSNPLLPYSNKFGFGLDFLLSPLEKLKQGRVGIFWITAQLHHYSNGQADSFLLDTPEKRNNYKNGDFSSNYWRGTLNFSGNGENKNLVIAGLGYQREVDMGGPLGSSNELRNYYGNGRILFNFQWIRKPKLEIVSTVNRGMSNGKHIKREVRRQFAIRTELDYITGDLTLFLHKDKYRWGWHNYFTYMPAVTNEVGFILHTYLGRDYLNIRFDDVVFIAGLGLYVRFNPQ
jgi:hypothetical protein